MPAPSTQEIPKRTSYVPFSFHIPLVAITAAGDVITQFTPGFVGSIVKLTWVTARPVTTGGKAATLNVEINGVDTVGGLVALTSATVTPTGKIIAGTAITGSNVFNKTDTISVEASSVTAFSQGDGELIILCSKRIYDG